MLCSLMYDKVTVPSQPLPSLGPSSSREPTSHSLLIRTKAESNLPAHGPDPCRHFLLESPFLPYFAAV